MTPRKLRELPPACCCDPAPEWLLFSTYCFISLHSATLQFIFGSLLGRRWFIYTLLPAGSTSNERTRRNRGSRSKTATTPCSCCFSWNVLAPTPVNLYCPACPRRKPRMNMPWSSCKVTGAIAQLTRNKAEVSWCPWLGQAQNYVLHWKIDMLMCHTLGTADHLFLKRSMLLYLPF